MAEDRVREPASPAEWDWAAHERAQRRRYASVPLVDKIAWLEDAQRMVLLLEEQRPDASVGLRDGRLQL